MTESETPRLQHFVPRFLLRNFAIEGTEQVHVFDKKDERAFVSNIKKVAAGTGFYDSQIEGIPVSIEAPLSQLESIAAKVIAEIIKRETLADLSDEDRLWLSLFVTTQFLRTRQRRVELVQMGIDLRQKMRRMGFDPSSLEDLAGWDVAAIKQYAVLSLSKLVIEFTPHILEKTWLLFRPPKSDSYFISDNPVVLHNDRDLSPRGNLGLAVPGIEIYLPLSARLILAILCPTHARAIRHAYRDYLQAKRSGTLAELGIDSRNARGIKRLKYGLETGNATTSEHDNIIHANSLQVIFSTRFVFSRDGNFDLIREMISKDGDLKEPWRIELV